MAGCTVVPLIAVWESEDQIHRGESISVFVDLAVSSSNPGGS